MFKPAILNESASYLGIAVAHSAFNVLCTAILLPASSLLEKLAYKIVPDNDEEEKRIGLDERLLAAPTIALSGSSRLVRKRAHEAVRGYKRSLSLIEKYDAEVAEEVRKLEDDTDHYDDVLGTFLTKVSRSQLGDEDSAEVSKLLKSIGDFGRISDHSLDVLESIEELREKKIDFSDDAKR